MTASGPQSGGAARGGVSALTDFSPKAASLQTATSRRSTRPGASVRSRPNADISYGRRQLVLARARRYWFNMAAFPSLNPFQSYLFPGERILWTGQPNQGIALSSRDVLLIPFSLLWGGFAIFWNVSVWSFPKTGEGIDWFMPLWGLPFLVAGLYLIFGRFIHDAALRKHLFYAVTDQRILILGGLTSPKLKSLDIHRLPKLELLENRDGTGTIGLDGDSSFFGSRRNGFGYWTPALSGAMQLLRIDNPRPVYELIRNQPRA